MKKTLLAVLVIGLFVGCGIVDPYSQQFTLKNPTPYRGHIDLLAEKTKKPIPHDFSAGQNVWENLESGGYSFKIELYGGANQNSKVFTGYFIAGDHSSKEIKYTLVGAQNLNDVRLIKEVK